MEGKILKALGEIKVDIKDIHKDLKWIKQTLAEHDEQLVFIREFLGEKVMTKHEFQQFHDEYLQDQDRTTHFLKRLDEDRLFIHGRIDRNDQDIRRLQTA